MTSLITNNYIIDQKKTCNFILYLNAIFSLNSYDNLIKQIESKATDTDIFNYIKQNMGKQEDLQSSMYKKRLAKKVGQLYNEVKSFIKPGRILDIGTEDIEYLKLTEKYFKMDTYGINIAQNMNYVGTNKNYDKFKIYDKIIPFDDQYFTLITIINVIHHVEDLPQFISEVSRVCKNYVYIKDVDLTDQPARDFFNLQHLIYEGGIFGDKEYYRNENMTLKFLIEEFQKHNFHMKSVNYSGNFNNAFVAVFHR